MKLWVRRTVGLLTPKFLEVCKKWEDRYIISNFYFSRS